MPIYEYQCKACGHGFDALQKLNEGALRKCPECGALKLQRLVSAPQFRLKGSGWYETDFKKDGKKRLVDAGEGKPAADPAVDKAGADKPAAAGKEATGKETAGKEAGSKKDAVEKKPVRTGKNPSAPSAAAD